METNERQPTDAWQKKGTLFFYLAEFIWRYVNRDKDLFRVF